ncbi:MAG: glycosyltransferase [Lachnospiraceae bacterium]
MEKIIYTKYNSTRKPEFRLMTSIIESEDGWYVKKMPIENDAYKLIDKIKNNYSLLLSCNYDYIPVEYCEQSGGLCFKYITGESPLDSIDFRHEKLETIINKIKDVIGCIFPVDDTNCKRFEYCDSFEEMFPTCRPSENEKSYYISNIDSIFDNFIIKDDKIWCIDYEWVVDFDVPIRYLVYRALHYLYLEKKVFLDSYINEETFLSQFDFSDKDIELFYSMEMKFQQYVYGENWQCDLLGKYEKKNNILNPSQTEVELLNKEIEMKNVHIKNLSAQIEIDTNKMENMNTLINQKDVHIGNLSRELKNKDVIIENKEIIIEDKDIHISNLNKIIKDKDLQIGALSEYVSKVKRAFRDPLYATKIFCKKILRRIKSKKNQFVDSYYDKKYRDLREISVDEKYRKWIVQLEKQDCIRETFEYNPMISVLVPVYNVLDKHLVPCIESVLNQIYTNWELCLVDDASTWGNVKKTLKGYENHERIKVIYREENGHISRATNSALEIATGEFVAFLDCDDLLSPNALYEVVKKLNEDASLDFIYSDEDKIDDDGNNRHMPHFKPDWSPDTLLSMMYTCHLGVYRRTILNKIGGFRVGYEGAQDYDMTLRFVEQTNKIGHISKILYHWRERAESTAGASDAKPYIIEANKRAKEDALLRRCINASVGRIENSFYFRIRYVVENNPKVSILIPSKDNYRILRRCVDSIYMKTEYKNFELILIDNGSSGHNKLLYSALADQYGFKYIYKKQDFNFSRMCNIAAQNASGKYFLFLNDDTEVLSGDWLELMLGQAQQSHVGAVGAKLLYPETENIQHVGIINLKVGPSHAFANYPDNQIYYFGRNYIEYNYIAVTGACLMIEKDKFEQVGGFDEELAVAYNDVDLCFKLVEAGYYNVVRNDVILLHYESISRGYDNTDDEKFKRLTKEREKLYQKHEIYREYDPFYNINLCDDNIDYSYNYSNVMSKMMEVSTNPVEAKDATTLIGNIDIVRNQKQMYIEGWAFVRGYRRNNNNSIVISLKGKNKTYYIHTEKTMREDVVNLYPNEQHIKYIGFKCQFEKESLESGNYQIGIICKKQLLITDKVLEII